MRTRRFLVAFSMCLALASCVIIDDDDDSELRVVNDSSYVIHEIRLATPGDLFFGPDLTGIDVLFPGESIVIDTRCDTFDIFLLDDLNVECVVSRVDVCFGGTTFYITNSLLALCDFGGRP